MDKMGHKKREGTSDSNNSRWLSVKNPPTPEKKVSKGLVSKRYKPLSRRELPMKMKMSRTSVCPLSVLTQNSPPPPQLKTATKQSSLMSYFGSASTKEGRNSPLPLPHLTGVQRKLFENQQETVKMSNTVAEVLPKLNTKEKGNDHQSLAKTDSQMQCSSLLLPTDATNVESRIISEGLYESGSPESEFRARGNKNKWEQVSVWSSDMVELPLADFENCDIENSPVKRRTVKGWKGKIEVSSSCSDACQTGESVKQKNRKTRQVVGDLGKKEIQNSHVSMNTSDQAPKTHVGPGSSSTDGEGKLFCSLSTKRKRDAVTFSQAFELLDEDSPTQEDFSAEKCCQGSQCSVDSEDKYTKRTRRDGRTCEDYRLVNRTNWEDRLFDRTIEKDRNMWEDTLERISGEDKLPDGIRPIVPTVCTEDTLSFTGLDTFTNEDSPTAASTKSHWVVDSQFLSRKNKHLADLGTLTFSEDQ